MMKNKAVIVTGGNAGIGYETALGISKIGSIGTYIVSRDETKAQASRCPIKGGKWSILAIDYFIADFSSQKSVRSGSRKNQAKTKGYRRVGEQCGRSLSRALR
jgi:NAD(P)-dependent dehydrogenase (short-subunit alcohol dehydrogenase family)